MSFERRRTASPLPRLTLPSSRLLKGPVGKGIAVTAGTFLLGYLLAARWLFPATEDPTDATFVDIPDLSGMQEGEGAERVGELGLVMSVAFGLHHPTLLSGTIVAQAPLPGQVARPAIRSGWR